MQTETSSGVGSDVPTSEYEFHVLVDEPPLQTSTPVYTVELDPLQTDTPVDKLDSVPASGSEPDESQAPLPTPASVPSLVRLAMARTAEEGPGGNLLDNIEIDVVGTADEAPQGAGGDPSLLSYPDVLNITPPQPEPSEAVRNVLINETPLSASTPVAIQPVKRELDPNVTTAQTRPRPPHLNGRKLIRVRDAMGAITQPMTTSFGPE